MSAASYPDGEAVTEPRGAARKRVLLSGKIAYGEGAFSYDCTIRDISASGAKLGIRGATVLPREFFLIDLKRSTAFASELVWRSATCCGVRFHAAYELANITDPKLCYLRRLYVESCLR